MKVSHYNMYGGTRLVEVPKNYHPLGLPILFGYVFSMARGIIALNSGVLIVALLFGSGYSGLTSDAFTMLSSNQLVFINVDHAPVGACSTFTYGYKGDQCGLGMSDSEIPYANGGGGVLIALSGPHGLKIMPFVKTASRIASDASCFADTNIQRQLTPCSDEWSIDSAGLRFTQYTPVWQITDLRSAPAAQKMKFFLPASWLVFTVNNTNAFTEDFYFGLPVHGMQKSFHGGAFKGFTFQEAAMAVQAGSCDLLSGADLTKVLNNMKTGFAFHLAVPAGETRSLKVVLAYYRADVVDRRIGARYYYTSLFSSIDGVIDAAFSELPMAKKRCQQLLKLLQKSGQNIYRQFLASEMFHSFQANTMCLLAPNGQIYWREMEGGYQNINTLDLTPDHAFYDAVMQPWALRNVLDVYSGLAEGGDGYTYTHPLYNVLTDEEVSTNGFSFHHDMGSGLTSNPPDRDPTGYESDMSYMGVEELQDWILSAGIYWSATKDDDWLKRNTSILQTCLQSLLFRDDTDPSKRDGIISYVNKRGTTEEITTYDSRALKPSLKQAHLNGRMTVRSWACYVALEAMFHALGENAMAHQCHRQARVCANTIVDSWNSQLGYIPVFLDGSNTNAIVAMVEGLAYPEFMGLTNATDRLSGPYALMLQTLRNHLSNVLVSGKCLDAVSGAWRLSSDSEDSFQSKVFLCQYVAENILGLRGSIYDGKIDQIHATLQATESPYQGCSDQIDTAGITQSATRGYPRGTHYPRGITTTLWWLAP